MNIPINIFSHFYNNNICGERTDLNLEYDISILPERNFTG